MEEALQLQFSSPAGSDQSLPAALESLAGGALAAAAASQAGFVRRGLGLAAGANAVVSNGRVVELPLEAGGGDDEGGAAADAALSTQDFELLELFAQRNQYSGQVAQLVRVAQQAGALGGADPSAVAAVVSSALAAGKPEEVRVGAPVAGSAVPLLLSVFACGRGLSRVILPILAWTATATPLCRCCCPTPQVDARSGRVSEIVAKQANQRNYLHLPSPAGQAGSERASGDAPPPQQPPLLLVQAILNPLSKPTQRLAPLLAFLRDALGAQTQLVLNPQVSTGGLQCSCNACMFWLPN